MTSQYFAPLLIGVTTVWPTVTAALVALFGCGAIVTRITSRPWWFGGLRQLVLGAAAATVTYGIGALVGTGFA